MGNADASNHRADRERARLPWYEVRGPHEAVPVQYVPQVQLEMLCTKTKASRFVSASACQGLNVFAVPRDDEYLAEMIHFIAAFWQRVQAGEPPSAELFWASADAPRYRAFLERTRALSEGWAVETHVRAPWRREGEDRFFLEARK